MDDNIFERELKNKLQNFEKAPPAGAFAGIQSKLAAKQGKKAGFMFPIFLKYGLAASVVFLMGMVSMNLINNNQNGTQSNNAIQITNDDTTDKVNNENLTNISKEENAITAEAEKQESINNSIESPLNHTSASNNNEGQAEINIVATTNSNTSSKKNNNKNKIVINVNGEMALKQNQQQEDITIYALYNFENELDNDGEEIVKVQNDFTNTRFESKPKNNIGYRGFWFGPEIGLESKLISNTLIMGNGIGVGLGYDFNGRFGLQSGARFSLLNKDVELYDTDGNEYHDLLDYSAITLPLDFKFKKSYFASKIERPVSFNTYIGVDYARIFQLDKNQFGTHIGMEYDIFLKPEMMVSIGMRAGLTAIPNYTPEQIYLQENYRKLNYSFGLYAALRFISPSRRN